MKTLSGWKEIASHLNQGIRTAQRWEHLGLPVHRVGSGRRSPVIAFAEELDAWEQAAPRHLLDEIQDLKNQVAALQAELRSLKGGKRVTDLQEMVKQARAMRETATGMRKALARYREDRAAREKSKRRELL
jgi:chromosome segregation ATPase